MVQIKSLINLFRHKVIADFTILAVGQYGGMVINIGFSLVLARLLAPADFGLIASAMFLLNMFNWVSEWGWESALMAHKQVDLDQAASTHFFVRFVLGAIPVLLVPFFATVFEKMLPSYAPGLLFFLALAYWIEKVGLTYKTVLERHSLLKSLALFEFISASLGIAAAVVAAFNGFGVFSLAIQRLVEKSIVLIGYIWASPWKFGFSFRWSIVKMFFVTFGVASWVGGLFNLAIYEYFMPFLIGSFAGMHQAGLFAKAFSLATFPLMLTAVCNRLLSPLYTQHQFCVPILRRCFVHVQTYKVFVLLPLQFFLAILAPTWIPMVFGGHWAEMVIVYQIMTFYGLVRAFFDDVPPLVSLGFKKPWELTKNQIVQSVLTVVVGPVAVLSFGACGGAFTMSFSMLVAAVLFWKVALYRIKCSPIKLFILARSAVMRPGGVKWKEYIQSTVND